MIITAISVTITSIGTYCIILLFLRFKHVAVLFEHEHDAALISHQKNYGKLNVNMPHIVFHHETILFLSEILFKVSSTNKFQNIVDQHFQIHTYVFITSGQS